MTPEDIRIQRAGRWKAFFEEEGGIRDMLDEIRMAYIDRMSAVEPWETGKLAKLAMARKIADVLESHVQAIMGDGKVASHAKAHAEKIENLPERKRRLLGLMPTGERF